MKYRAFSCLVALTVVGALLSGCGVNPPVNSNKHLQGLIEYGQTLEHVQGLMTDTLKDRMTIYPAQKLEKQANGSWTFKAAEGGEIGDTDAPFVVLVIKPDPTNTKYLTIFLQNGLVITSEWFSSTGAAIIHRVLGNLLETQ